MKRRPSLLTIALAIVIVVPAFMPAITTAVEIQTFATDLPDPSTGDDLWRYDFSLSSGVFDANDGFSIYFDNTLYGDLTNPGVANADWDLLALSPDVALPADGLFDGLALVDGASLGDLFSVEFVWLGAPSRPDDFLPFQT